MPTTPRHELRLFGPVSLVIGGAGAVRPGAKGAALLAFLAVQPGGVAGRTELATLLWGGSCEAEARHALRQAVFTLRQQLGEACGLLHADRETVALDLDSVTVDLGRFERAWTAGNAVAAAELATGTFAEGLDVRSEPFEEWLRLRRSCLEDRVCVVLREATERLATAGRQADAIRMSERLLALDPLEECVRARHARLVAATAVDVAGSGGTGAHPPPATQGAVSSRRHAVRLGLAGIAAAILAFVQPGVEPERLPSSVDRDMQSLPGVAWVSSASRDRGFSQIAASPSGAGSAAPAIGEAMSRALGGDPDFMAYFPAGC